MVPTVDRKDTHSRKYNGLAQINYLNAFINLFGHWGEIKKIYQKCTINSEKITVVHIWSQWSTVKISSQIDKYDTLYINDKLQGLILVKIVIPIKMCQTTDFIFFIASLKPINTIQKFVWQYVTYF